MDNYCPLPHLRGAADAGGGEGVGGGGAAAAAGASAFFSGFGGAAPNVSLKISCPDFTVVPVGTSISAITPLLGAGTGIDVLSVSISATISSSATASPLFFSHL